MPELDALLSELKGGDFQARWEAAKVLPQFGEAALEVLLRWLQDGVDEELEWFIIRILGEIHHPQSVVALVKVLETGEDDELCLLATQALARLGADQLQVLTNLLHAPQTRRYALRALSQIHHPQALEALLLVAQDPDPQIRVLTVEALSQFRDSRVLPVLRAALGDDAASVRGAAIAALGRHPNCDSDFVQKIYPHLQDIDLRVCQTTALALSRLGTPAAFQHLSACLVAPPTPAELRLSIIQALAYFNTPEVIDQFRSLLSASTLAPTSFDLPAMLEAMLKGIAQMRHPETQAKAVFLLVDWLTSPQPEFQRLKPTIVNTLGQLGHPQALPALMTLLAEPDLRLRLHVIAALKQIDSEGTYAQLQQQVDSSAPALQAGIKVALQEW
ncbi:PBS lyase [Synechococcales cyanobacterium C]|uniref:PBS lyase n=1 Tax=Petrachloros mirabilis ULC683 TaxID=2781853 RepID=A0A8K1ZW36_9CYAN|nr:HEAT repeat domain-containing protein [Petrachloros mirabilis]NCJ04928.1 PBS lyase [Petrachloros mirabilis ULC683]